MKLRSLLACLLCVLFLCPALFGETTAAERQADQAAQHELDSSPRDGNIPSYSLSPADLAKAQHLNRVDVTLHFFSEIWGIVVLIGLLALGIIARFRDEAVGRFPRSRWLQGFGFVLLFLIATWLLSLPIDMYAHSLSLHYGLSVQHWGSWFWDQAKALALSWVFGGLVVMLLFWIIRKLPQSWWVVFWACSIVIVLFGIFVSPYIAFLFDKFEPLQKTNPALVQQLEAVAHKGNMNIPPDRMFLMKASAKVTTINAYVAGFGASKRVVVWDTSIAKASPDQILFIFGHESGHYVLHHIVRGVLFTIAMLLVLLYLGYHAVGWMLDRYGSRWRIPSQSDWGSLAVLMLAFSVFSLFTEPMFSAWSRGMEHAADIYGQEAVHGIVANPRETAKTAFDVLGQNTLEDPNPNQFIEFWTAGHPAIGRRAAFAAHYDPWAPGMEPKYFSRQ